MPYSVHRGAMQHLLSFQELVRNQRNDAVHPKAAPVTREAVFLSLQTFPTAVSVVDRLSTWYAGRAEEAT